MDGVVPVAMKLVTFDVQFGQFVVGDLGTKRVGFGVEFRLDAQSLLRSGVRGESDDNLVAEQRASALVLRDVGKHSVFDLVPFACSRREGADMIRDVEPR